MDHDFGKDESLGICIFDFQKVMEDKILENVWLNLENVKSGRVQISLKFDEGGYNDSGLIPLEGPLHNDYRYENTEMKTETFEKPTSECHGKIRLNIFYDEHKEELKVFVHEAANLPGSRLPDPPDPYVKICLMPGKKKKKKTGVVKDTGSPIFNEEFDLKLAYKDLPKYSLKVSVLDKKGLFTKSSALGRVDINLDNPGLKQGLADWFPLEDTEEDSD